MLSLSFGVNISGDIIGLSGKHPVVVNLYNLESWAKNTPFRQLVVPTEIVGKTFKFEVPTGDYGIVVIEDKDRNGKLSFGLFGPSEPAKVYNLDKIVFGPPDFNDFKFSVSSDIEDLTIKF